MFMVMLMGGGTLLHAYVLWRAASVPFLTRHFSRRVLRAIGAALWVGLVVSLELGHGATGAWGWMLEIFGMSWLAVLFITALTLLLADLVTVFGLVLRRLAPSIRGWALLAAGALSAFAVVQGVRPPVVRDYEVHLAGLRPELDGTVVVALSDLHLGTVLGEGWLAARVAQVQALRPDIVVVLGDVFEGHGKPSEGLLRELHRISAPFGVWAVTGNHEFHGRRVTDGGLLEDVGFNVLHDRWAEVRPGLVLAGVDDLTSRRRARQTGDLVGPALAGRPAGPAILLSHTPWQADRAAASGAALMLSGHTHGGQIWPFGLLERGVYPLLAGAYEVDGMPVIVSRGTGSWGPRMRLWQPSEIVRITLRAAPPPRWEVYAIRYATLAGFAASDLVAGAEPGRTIDIAMAFWLLKGPGGRNVLVDTGFHRDQLFERWRVEGYINPGVALARLGLSVADISDVIITHMHWDHAGGVDLFPNARVWIQEEEWEAASDPSKPAGGVTAADIAAMKALAERGRLRMVGGDAREVIPGITLYVGGRHTPGSQFAGVATRDGPVVVASDAVYLYENLEKSVPIAQTLDPAANLEAQRRMRSIACSPRLIVPGHDPAVFVRFPKPGGGVARID